MDSEIKLLHSVLLAMVVRVHLNSVKASFSLCSNFLALAKNNIVFLPLGAISLFLKYSAGFLRGGRGSCQISNAIRDKLYFPLSLEGNTHTPQLEIEFLPSAVA